MTGLLKAQDLWLANRKSKVVKDVNEHLRSEDSTEETSPRASPSQPLFGLHPHDVQNLNRPDENE